MKKNFVMCSLMSALFTSSGVALAATSSALTTPTTGVATTDSNIDITFSGVFTLDPCNIAISGGNTVDLGRISSTVLKRQGAAGERDFTINLSGCPATGSPQLKFTGIEAPEHPELFGMTGTTTGAAIEILSSDRNWRMANNVEYPLRLISGGNYDLTYKVRVVNTSRAKIEADALASPPVLEKPAIELTPVGNFSSTVGLTITYL